MQYKNWVKNRVVIYILFCIITSSIIAIAINQKTLISCISIRYSNFKEIGECLYFSPQISEKLKDSLLILVHDAERRNEKFWSTEPLEYTIIFCSSKKELEKYTGRKDVESLSYLTPLGTFIVLGNKGYNVDVISHEMSHSILLQLVGFKTMQKIPTWFSEGIALQVDYRDIVTDSTIETNYHTDFDYLSSISNFKDFHDNDWNSTRIHYIKSRYEIKQWLTNNKDKLALFLNGIRDDEFIKHYKESNNN